MRYGFDRVYVRHGLGNRPEVRRLLERLPDERVSVFSNIRQVVVPGTSLAEKIANGKRVLVVDKRSASLIDQFVNHDPGSVCPSFHKLIPGTNCPYHCQYCFLAGTYRACRPFVCVYVIDFPKLEKELRPAFGARGTTVVNAGEMSDPLACDVLCYMPRLVELFGVLDNLRLLLLTKSGVDEVQPLLHADHRGHTIVSWSVTCDAVIQRYEPGNVPLRRRLDAAKAAQDAGYEVRFRIDPIMLFDGLEDAFARTVAQVYELGIHPSRFTLGSFRLLGNLPGIIKARFPESDILEQPLVNEVGRRRRYPHEVRKELYLHVLACIRKHDANVPVALCKETREMQRTFDGLVDVTKCNCVL